MKKQISTTIILLVLASMLSGCSSVPDAKTNNNAAVKAVASANKVAAIPEPYTMAIQEIKEQNLDKALRYLDLVIKDFPDNEEYIYRAYFLKTIIYTDYYTADLALTDALLEGVKDNPFLESGEKQQILDSIQTILDQVDKYKQPFLESTAYVYEHYEKYKNLDFSLHYQRAESSTEAINAVEWFRKSGTPMPSDDQINSALHDARIYCLGVSLDELIKRNNVNYPAYFYATGGVANGWDKELAKKLAQKVIDITENDKYNKYRLDAEDALK